MFGAITVAGIDIVSSVEIGRRDLMIIAVSLALGLGVVYVTLKDSSVNLYTVCIIL